MRRLLTAAATLFITAAALFVPSPSYAQNQLCFNVPGITNCISGRFREYWEQNGGLPVFGYPITAAQNEVNPDTGQTYLTQWFERNRFELHTENARPYDVLLGRLGDDRLKQQGRNWHTFPKGTQTGACLWFAETGHSVCEPFRSYWEGHGLEDPALSRFAQSLALFGMPLSEPAVETNASGHQVLTQWFERARFEHHPGNAPEHRVLLGLLGNEIRAGGNTPPPTTPPTPPTNPPTQPPADPCADIAAPRLAIVDPNCVRYGDELYVEFYGFEPNEQIGFWITQASSGATIGTVQTVRVNAQGRIGGTLDTTDFIPPGDYLFVAQDAGMEREPSIAPFRVLTARGERP